jgi:hypothetical protein
MAESEKIPIRKRLMRTNDENGFRIFTKNIGERMIGALYHIFLSRTNDFLK